MASPTEALKVTPYKNFPDLIRQLAVYCRSLNVETYVFTKEDIAQINAGFAGQRCTGGVYAQHSFPRPGFPGLVDLEGMIQLRAERDVGRVGDVKALWRVSFGGLEGTEITKIRVV